MTKPLTLDDADGRLENPRAVADGFAPEITTRPLRLHTTLVEGPLGGHAFSADFARYLARVKPRLTVGWQMRVAYWWASAYGRARVERAFVRQMGAERGHAAYRVALILGSGYWSEGAYARLMTETGHSAGWLSRIAHLALAYADQRAA